MIVPGAIDAPIARGLALLARLRELGIVDDRGAPGPGASRWSSSFRSVRIEDPGRVVSWSNRLGGFRPTCPRTGAPIVGPFSAALTAWRAAGGPPGDVTLRCPGCGDVHALPDVDVAPPLAFAPWAVVTGDVETPSWTPEAAGWIAETIGAATTVLRRG